MTDLIDILDKLGLSIYTAQFIDEGFDSWETLCNIRESDLGDLGVKLGHRRKLQKAISEFLEQGGRPKPAERNSTSNLAQLEPVKSNEPIQPCASPNGTHGNARSVERSKRKYKRHPRPDSNAPERPPSAYVLFSNNMREELRDQNLSFTEMAKLVGERWQLLPSDVREHYEQRASAGKEKYNMLMAEYRRTEDYSHYQKYLADFKAKNVAGKSTGERPKMRPENSTETQSSHESLDDLSPQATASRLYNKASHGSDGTQFDDGRSHVGSPAASHTSILQSATASPTSNQGSRFSAYDLIIRHNGSHGDQDGLRALPPTTSVGFPPSSPPNDRLPMVLPQSSTKEIQEGTRLPVSLPSISRDPMVSYTRDTSNSPGTTFQAMNIGNDRARRTLPTLPSLGLGASTIEARARVAPSSPRDTGSGSAALAALLRAGELARETDDRSIAVSRNSR